jgi:hypothetical protein
MYLITIQVYFNEGKVRGETAAREFDADPSRFFKCIMRSAFRLLSFAHADAVIHPNVSAPLVQLYPVVTVIIIPNHYSHDHTGSQKWREGGRGGRETDDTGPYTTVTLL